MGVPWLVQVRVLHLVMLGLVMITLLLYVGFITSPQPTTTALPLRSLILQEVRVFSGNHSIPEISLAKNVTTSPVHNASSEAPPVHHIIVQPDLTRGIATKQLYEPGHADSDSELCPQMGTQIKLLVVITSAPSHDNARMAIRETWGHFASRRDVAIAFILGSTSNISVNASIEKEQELYGDIIRGNFVDTYDNLTLKTISMLEWVDKYCPKADFVLKTDDDMFINISKLLLFIEKHNSKDRAIYGRLAKKWKPIRNKKSKYYISPQQYKPGIFPDFTTGPAYLFPAQLCGELYAAALNTTYLKLEDVFLTGIVASSLKIQRIYSPEFLNKRVSLTTCSVQKGISIHMIKGFEQYDIWKKLHDIVTKCK